jgi:Methyltransferase domain
MEIKYRRDFIHLLTMYRLAGHAVEIGVAEGRNAQDIIMGKNITKLYLIDNWGHLDQSGDGGHPQSWHDNNYNEAIERVEPWREKAVFLKGKSEDMLKEIPDNSLVFAYIDCDHSKEGFMKDLVATVPKVIVGGIIAGHDVLNPDYGVAEGLMEWATTNNYTWDIHYTDEDGDKSMVSFWFIKK